MKGENNSIACSRVIDLSSPEWVIVPGVGRRSDTPARIGIHNTGRSFRKRALSGADFSFGSARM